MFTFYGNSKEDALSVWAVFTIWSIKQVMCKDFVVCTFMCGYMCRKDEQA